MKKLILILLTISFIFCGCDVGKKETESSNYSLVLYKIEDEKGNYSYLFGTIHIGKEDIVPFREQIEQAYQESDVVAVEADLTEVTNEDYSTNYPLKSYDLSEEQKTEFEEIASEYGYTYAMLEHYSLSTIESAFIMVAASYADLSYQYGLDNIVLEKAKKDNKTIYEVEGLEKQMEFLETFDQYSFEHNQVEFIRRVDLTRAYRELYTAMLNADQEMLQRYANDYKEEPFYQSLVYQRNLTMYDSFVKFIEGDSICFFAVGAGHLFGDDGILALLETNGYQITKI